MDILLHPAVLLILIVAVGGFSAIGAFLLWVAPWPGLRRASLFWFVVSAFFGAAAYAIAFVAILGTDPEDRFMFLLYSIPLAGSLFGWLGAGAVTLISQRTQR
jgi:hypothetical protein